MQTAQRSERTEEQRPDPKPLAPAQSLGTVGAKAEGEALTLREAATDIAVARAADAHKLRGLYR